MIEILQKLFVSIIGSAIGFTIAGLIIHKIERKRMEKMEEFRKGCKKWKRYMIV